MNTIKKLPSIVNNLTNKDSKMNQNQLRKHKLYKTYDNKLKLENLNLPNPVRNLNEHIFQK